MSRTFRKAARFWTALRPFSLTVSIFPPLLAALLVLRAGYPLALLPLLLTLLGCLLSHGAVNMLSDVDDHQKGVDRPGTSGSSGLLQAGAVSPQTLNHWGHLTLGGALVSGLLLLLLRPRILLPLTLLLLLGLLLGLFYTRGPLNWKYRALGDPAVFLAFGPAMTLGAWMVQTQTFSWTPILISIPSGFLVDAILHSNNLRDMAHDREVPILTLPLLVGAGTGKHIYRFLILGAYASSLLLVLTRHLPWTVLLILLSLPLALQRIRAVDRLSSPPQCELEQKIDAFTAQVHAAFSLLLLAGLGIPLLLPSLS